MPDCIEKGKFMLKRLMLSLFLLVISFSASAWDGTVSGKVFTIDVTGGTNYGFRVTLSGGPKLCGNDHAWAYLNDNDSNYNTYVSVLLAAKLADRTVTIYTNRKGGTTNGYCHIGYIVLK
jgi:hypothetical protein